MSIKVAASKATYNFTLPDNPSGSKWINYGANNNYPQEVLRLYRNANVHRAICNSKMAGIRGRGISSTDPATQAFLDRINPEYSANELLARLAHDYVLFGGVGVEVVYDAGAAKGIGTGIAQVNHLDYSRLRSGKIGYANLPDHYYYSKDWRTSSRRVIRIDAFDSDSLAIQASPRQLLHFRNYNPGNDYYPEPDYIGGITDIEAEYELAKFRLSNTKNAFISGVVVTVPQQMTDEQKDLFERNMELKFTGAENAGSIVYNYTDGQETNKLTIEPLQNQQYDTVFTQTTQDVLQGVMSAHRLSSPVQASLPGAGGLGGNASEIAEAREDFDSTVLAPLREALLDNVFRRIANGAGLDGKSLTITPNDHSLKSGQNTAAAS